MAWTTPVTQTTGTLITAALWNEQIENNETWLGVSHDHTGDPGDGGDIEFLRSGMIAMFDAACPAGWTRVSAWDGKFIRGAATYGGGGGSNTHYHSVASHTHTMSTHTHGWNHTHSVSAHTHDQQSGGTTTTAHEDYYVKAGNLAGATMFTGTGGSGSQYWMAAGAASGGSGSTNSGNGSTTADAGGSTDAGTSAGNTSTDTVLPSYINVVFCKKN